MEMTVAYFKAAINICLDEGQEVIRTSSLSQDSQPPEHNSYFGPSKYKTTELKSSVIPKFIDNNANI
jgi:hypothetical protein